MEVISNFCSKPLTIRPIIIMLKTTLTNRHEANFF